MLPDMLEKSYFLEDRVFSLVKSVDDIQGICKRLKVTYADTEIQRWAILRDFWKPKNLAKTRSHKYNIDQKLCNGDTIEPVHKLLRHIKATPWLPKTFADELEGKDLWRQPIIFNNNEYYLKFPHSIENYSKSASIKTEIWEVLIPSK